MVRHWGTIQTASEHSIKPPTARDLWDLLKVTYSIPGGNRPCLENDTICHRYNWLAEVQDGECPPLTVAMVLEFATGATVVTPLGFEDTPTIEFLHTARGRLARQQNKKYPEANTCAVTLRLPLHSTYNAFREFMTSCIVNSPHFGVA
ncbi:G2/M phase-specific E3 ubiquitin-protein ligase-like [Oncorhynchus keta]|uniref:G2/M phase-specific E3 ubiquitin-protein ligase-like n=1 Tax=Oncorhynchus keta TaxID=8018 RepID=UPI0015FCFC7F|nr:G2/M phase-specific E3 ubiquitin-protein ligase-like [Oncorhynchus keta]